MRDPDDLVVLRPQGLYCPLGDFYIDPWRPVARALITHAHADHARSGHAHYLCADEARHVMRARLGAVSLQTLSWGERLQIGSVSVSFHPAGHVLGSAQIRIELSGQIWVVTGDYKLAPDSSCRSFEPVHCHTLVTESTFGLPVYRWQAPEQIFRQVLDWWRSSAREGRPCLLFAYSLGKAQRLIAGLHDAAGGDLPGPLRCHAAAEAINRAYRASGVALPEVQTWRGTSQDRLLPGMLAIAPPALEGQARQGRTDDARLGLASGWMQVRGARRRRALDRGFVLSDHADWAGLNTAIEASGAYRVIVTHGFESVMVRHLRERGLDASSFATEFGHEREESSVVSDSVSDAPPADRATDASETQAVAGEQGAQ
ncbi:MAG: hypothetical protein RL322_765 [Pseudomonadota bacterium]